mgnify:CR=1 FL=1
MISVFQSPEELRTFALNVLKQGNLDNMPSESREAYIDKISMQVQQFVGMAVMNELSEKGSEELAKVINKDDNIILINSDGIVIRLEVNEISVTGRATSGVRLMRLQDDVKLVALAKVIDTEEDEEVGQE